MFVGTATALLLAGCGSTLRSLPPPSPPAAATVIADPRQSLTDDLASLFDAPGLAHAHFGVVVQSLLTGETLFARNAKQLLVPASNQKLLTVAAAAKKLGWDYRFSTRVVATGPIDEQGVLRGDLVVIGSGDPTINPRHPERWRALDDWAAQIAAQGVRTVTGDLIGDDNAFAEPGWGSGWSWDDLSADYGSPIGALQYHENEIELLIGPGLTTGRPAIVATAPYGHGLLIDNQVTTVAEGEPARLSLDRLPGEIWVTARGQVPVGAGAIRRRIAVDNPTRLFVNAFREALSRHGVVVAGWTRDIDDPPPGDPQEVGPLLTPLTNTARREPGREESNARTTLVTDHSPPLYEIVVPLLKASRNGYAETILWALSPPGSAATEAAGLTVLRDTLAGFGLDRTAYGAFDGSGLSRYDMVSAEALVRVLAAIWNDPALVGPYRSALPIAGVDGSLANQMRGTAAERRVWAKTGSMFNIRSLSGYVLTSDHEPLAFSFLANNYTVPSAEIEAMYDRALERIAAFRR